MDQNIIQKAISNVKNTAQRILAPATNKFLEIRTAARNLPTVQNIKNVAATPIKQNNLTRGLESFVQSAPAQFGSGLISGQNLGLTPVAPTPKTTAQKIAYGLGSFIGGANPYGATGAITRKVVGLTNPIISKAITPITSKVSGNVSKAIAPRIAAGIGNVGQGLALNPALGQKTTPLGVGLDFTLGVIGGPKQFESFNVAAKVKPKVELNGKQARQIMDAIDRFANGEVKFNPNKSAIDREIVKTVMDVAKKQAPEHFKTGKVTFEQALKLANQAVIEHQMFNYPMVGRGNQIPNMNLVGESKGLTPEVNPTVQKIKSNPEIKKVMDEITPGSNWEKRNPLSDTFIHRDEQYKVYYKAKDELYRLTNDLISKNKGNKTAEGKSLMELMTPTELNKYKRLNFLMDNSLKEVDKTIKVEKFVESGLTPEVTTKVKIKPKTKPVITQERIQLPVENISPTETLSLPQGDYTLKQPIGETTSKYNIGRNKTINQRILKQALDDVAPAFKKEVGGPITHKQILQQASEFSDDVIKTIGRKTTEDLGAAQLRLRQNIASMADTGKVTPELLEAMKTDASFARSTAQLLGQRAIDANPQTPFGKNMIKYIKAVNEVADNIDLVVEKAKGVDFNDIEQASTFYRQFIKPTVGDWVDKLRFSSMLSSPNTVINNLSSNFQGTGLLAPIEKTISGGIDAIVSGLTGSQRKHFAGEGIEYAKGYWSNMKTALQDFANAMRGGSDAGEMYNVKLTKKGTGGRVAEETLSFFPRLAQATDEFFSALTSGGLEKANAYRVAKGGVNQTADQIALEAKRRLFNQPFGSDQSHLLNALEFIPSKIMDATHSKNPFVKWTAKFAFPFIRIPTNVFKAGIEYSPLGVATLPGANNKIEQASKALMGTTVALGAWQLANADRLTFGMPTSEKQRDAFTAAGMQPYSIKIGDKWFSYTKFHPIVGFNMALASALKEQLDKKTLSDDQLDTVIGVAGKWLTYFANQSYVKQMGDFMSLSQGNETAVGKAIGNYPSQLIPFRAFLGWLARAFDPYERKIDPNGSKLDKSLQSIMMSIPGARNKLLRRTTSQGLPVEQQNRFLNLVSPSKVTNEVPQEKQIYDTLRQKSIQTSKENAIKAELKASNGNSQSLGGNRYIVIDKNTGDALTIDLSPIQKPTSTGNTELDKKLFSNYNSKITSQISDVTKLYEAGQITSSKAEELIKQLQSQKTTTVKSKKPKKISIKKISVPKIKASKAKKIKIKSIKVPKVKKIKLKKIKQQKLSKLKTIKYKA